MIRRCPASVVRPSVVRRPLDNLHFQLFLQNRLMDCDETWYGLLKVPYKCCCFSARIRPLGVAKSGHGGPFPQRTSSSDWKATATNQMHSGDLEAFGKRCYFLFHSEVRFLTRF